MTRRRLMLLGPGLAAVLAAGTALTGAANPDEPTITLPRPSTSGGMAVSEAIAQRRSQRHFTDTPLAPAEISQLCWAAQGITDAARGRRASPSAGALYPMTVYVVDARGVFEYQPRRHALRRVVEGDQRQNLQAAALGQACVGAGAMCMVIAMNVDRTATKYGSRALRYCLMEAGHVAQNVMLQATDLGLGGVTVGAFHEERVAAVLELSEDLRAVYLLPLGHPR